MTAIFSRFRGGQQSAGRSVGKVVLAALCVALSAAGCHKSEDPVTDTVNELARAARDRDAKALLDLVAADFQAADGSRKPDLEPTLRQFFAAWESLDVTVRDLKVERSENAALARFRLDLSGRARKIPGLEGLLPSSSSWQFETRLAPSNGRWRVTWASWSPAP
ncbi:MAG: hypothetical protein ABI914_03420 [Acidobacteriota bacterium]